MNKDLIRIIIAFVLFLIVEVFPFDSLFEGNSALYAEFIAFLVPYLIAGYEVLIKAGKNIIHGHALDENFLMCIASLGAFALVFFPESEPHMAEGAAVMIFYQVGELFEDYAVDKSRDSISSMMDIAPEFAFVWRNGEFQKVSPEDLKVGERILVKPGERIPVDGIVIEGESEVDTAALTGESLPQEAIAGSEVVSGCVNMTSPLTIQVAKLYGESTVSRILELVENASEKKARTENFITRFARYYTPIVVGCAVVLAILPPLLLGQPWSDWVQRGLCFLVVSCPCALVISVPLSFFGGIGAASRKGILVKGSNYLELLSKADTIVFDKTGTLTTGTFSVEKIVPSDGFSEDQLLELSAAAELFSNHPIALSIRNMAEKRGLLAKYEDAAVQVEEHGGHGISALVNGREVHVGNDRLLETIGIQAPAVDEAGTVLHVLADGTYAGYLLIKDTLKSDAIECIANLKSSGNTKTVMLTGDREEAAREVAEALGIDEYHSHLLPQDKVSVLEDLLSSKGEKCKLAFVGDGINDAPVLMRSDIGIAMGAMGSDAAIEAADIVLMDDRPSNIATAKRISKRTMGIVWQNIIFALGIKVVILILAALGIANMWIAVFGDVGVAVLAILNAMRALRVK